MKINITKKDYQLLLDFLVIGDWVMQSHCHPGEVKHQDYDALKLKFYSFYKHFSCEALIEQDNSEKDTYYETDLLMESVNNRFMTEYENNVFWDELIHRLAVRDVVKDIGQKAYDQLGIVERISKQEVFRERYKNEFAEHDLNRVIIAEGQPENSKLSTEN